MTEEKKLGIMKKAVSGGHITWKEGELFVWSVPGFITPTYTHIEFLHKLKEECDGTEEIFYAVGEKQTILAVDYMMKKFGFKRKIDIVNSVLEQSTLLGYGEFKIVNINFETGHAIFKNVNNPIAKHYRAMYGVTKKPIDSYLSGTKAGLIEAITGKKLVAIETKCLAQGDSYCLFEVKPLEDFSKELQEKSLARPEGPDNIRDKASTERALFSSQKK